MQPATPYRNADVDESEDQIAAGRKLLTFLHVINLASAVRYLHLYDALAADVTVGSTTPVQTYAIPTQGDANGAGFVLPIAGGLQFQTGITIAATTAADGTGAPGADEVLVNAGYF